MLERFVGPDCGADKAIQYARTFGNEHLDSIASALENILAGKKVAPMLVTANKKEEIMKIIDQVIGGFSIGKDQFTGQGAGIEFNPHQLPFAKYYKTVADELYQVQSGQLEIKSSDYTPQEFECFKEHGFNLVIGDEFELGVHCPGKYPCKKSHECYIACFGTKGILTTTFIEEAPCVKYGATVLNFYDRNFKKAMLNSIAGI